MNWLWDSNPRLTVYKTFALSVILREHWNRYKYLNLNLLVRSQASYPLDDNDIEPTQ